MGFLNGRVTYVRFRVSGSSPLPFGDEILEQIQLHALGRHGGPDPTDGITIGWAGGDHVLDLTFDPVKNLLNDALHLSIRIDTDKIPGTLLKAYTKIETDARAQLNPSGYPTKAQRQEAKEAAIIRAEAEASDGRFRRMAHYPVLWDAQSNVLYAGMTSLTAIERLKTLFRETFDRTLEPITAGSLAYSQAEVHGLERSVEDFGPVGFVGEGGGYSTVAWADSDASSRDFWGNEFLIWLWHTLQIDGDTITLPDDSEVTVMMAKTLTLDCPLGEHGRDALTTEGPTKLPEAFRAIQAGKLPRKAGLILVRNGLQYELTLQAETLAVSGASLPKPEGISREDAKPARIEGLRHLVETLDLLYDAYGRCRTGPEWSGELGRIRLWLKAA
ncbi:hypothetical protein [Singulisphaera acidiphila]|uniref:Recombination-associated protein RdgC n=1 Tax=Singulisphaera acidiphila (strain ATCC BAA-1392 / DSM 18658 / VKM B-2454 / MOB10) TaxID=886293 RepID=L0D9S8_SINAD|nr:hypothetical protein [Singulisphaera acidiphila]AGA25376.1 hypothetical protein Sinac_0973 [Singulisphaera acidiphila DSM 18658]